MITPTEYTTFLKWGIPGEDSDPFMEAFQALTVQQEAYAYYNNLMANMMIVGGGTKTWDGVNGILQWTDDFSVPVLFWGKRLLLRYGPTSGQRNAVLQNGQALVVNIPSSLNSNQVIDFTVVSQLDQTKANQWIAAWRLGSTLHTKGMGDLT